MALNMRTSRAGLDVVKAFEGFRPRYQALPNGRWIIGYGHVRKQREGVRVSEPEAEAILREYDLPPVERYIQKCVLAPLSQSEFDALVSLAFNIGPKAFASSDVVAHINGGNRLAAAGAFDQWRRAKIGGRVQIVDALVRRRAAEKALFLKTPGNTPIASSRFYRALHDNAGALEAPKQREILVERHVELPALGAATAEVDTTVDVSEASQTPTEEAAEAVRRQMVRILGENGHKVSEDVSKRDGASPEEITAAVSELAGETSKSPVQKSVWPQREDLPPPPQFTEPLVNEAKDEPSTYTNGAAHTNVSIDDLEEVTVSEESIARAIEENEAIEAETREGHLLEAMPYGLLALIGAGLGGYGLANQIGLVESGATVENEMAVYLPPFLILLGGLLFAVMAYYFFRTLFTRD